MEMRWGKGIFGNMECSDKAEHVFWHHGLVLYLGT